MLIKILLVLGVIVCSMSFWYFWYGLELFLNGANMERGVHFRCLWEELTWVGPGGWGKRLKYCDGDVELARSLPGICHFFLVHIVIPFLPSVIFWYLYS